MNDEQRRWFGTGLKGLCALILVLGLPAGYFSSYADNIVDFFASATGRIPDGFAKFFYIVAPFVIIEIACTGVLVFATRVFRRYYENRAIRRFNGFYRWESIRKERGQTGVIHHLFYINNSWRGFILSFINHGHPSIRYWRYCKNEIITGHETEFHYGILFQKRSREKSNDNVVILIGTDTNERENVILKCSLVPNNKETLRIITYRENASSQKSEPIPTNSLINKQLRRMPESKHNEIIRIIFFSPQTSCA